MSKDVCCPLCGSKILSKSEVSPNEKYFLFDFDNKWICKNCGCFFSEQEEYYGKLAATKISKKEFFSIIFEAIREISGRKYLTKDKQKEVMDLYNLNIKTYYKEVAELQANLFYETDCRHKEYWLMQQVHPQMEKGYLK
ncbi:MAG: hypothetical protein K2I88_04560 [Anaeroplasmataceae bacterium]|nr:hypothetical protein [Anaeroplasmataceae bacterium]